MSVSSYLKKEAVSLGYVRERFIESDIPEQPKDVVVISFYGDIRSLFTLSTFLLKRLIDPNKYYILCTWPGFKDLFPYVNEYWSLKDESTVKKLMDSVGYFKNDNDYIVSERRNLLYRFENVVGDLNEYYNDGFTQVFWDKFKDLYLYLPQVGSVNKLPTYITNQLTKRNLFICPTKKIGIWHEEKLGYYNVSKEFWVDVIRSLSDEFDVIVWQNAFSHDVSPDLAETCFYLNNVQMDQVLIVMNHCVVIDIFNGISRLAILARSRFIAVDERERQFKQKDSEIDEVCNAFGEYVFSDGRMAIGGEISSWKTAFLDVVVKKAKIAIDKPLVLSLNQSYDLVSHTLKEITQRKFGLQFIKKY